MWIDEAKLRAYLDDELPEQEREWVEKYLINLPEAQVVLAQLRQEMNQVKQDLDLLTPTAGTFSPAASALKRLQAQLEPSDQAIPLLNEASPQQPSSVVWESPSLWSELKTIFKNSRIKRGQFIRGITMKKGFALMTVVSLLIVVSAIAFTSLGSGQIGRLRGGEGDEARGELPILVEAATPTDTPVPPPAPTPTNTPIPPTPTPAPGNVPFGYGIQADPLGDTETNVSSIKELGFAWVKFQMPWKTVEPTPGNYDWRIWDKVIDAYAADGIKVMLNIVKAPDWARPADDDKDIEGPPADPVKYAEFVAQVTDRYRGKVQAIEVWDEQNLWYKAGGKGRISAADYVKLLQQAYTAIKAINPELMVISGAMTPAGNVADRSDKLDLAIDDVNYLKQMYTNGVKGYFDALGAHPSGYNCPAMADWRTVTPEEASADSFLGPFTTRHHSWCFLGTMEAYREVMVANGDGDKAIAITEFGWAVSATADPNMGYGYALDNTPEEQAKWIVEAYQWGKQQGWVGPMFLWNLDYSVTAPDIVELGYFSILNTPTYEALVKMPK